MLREKFSKFIVITSLGEQRVLTDDEIDKMLKLCQKRKNPSYYKLGHATGLSEEYSFKGVDYYIVDMSGKKSMRRLEEG